MKRITRLECASFDKSGKERFNFKWTRGTMIIKTVYAIFKEHGLMPSISFEEFFDCVRSCKENSNVLMDDENGFTLQIRRWSYNRKK